MPAVLAVLQVLLGALWVIYVVHLPALVARAGLAAWVVPTLLVLDQVVFAVTDPIAGAAGDAIARAHRRIGPYVVAGTVLSCVAFLAIPLTTSPAVMTTAIVVWALSSSALRAPLGRLVADHAARPTRPLLVGMMGLGLGIAPTLQPFAAEALLRADPRLPFAISSIVLALAGFAVLFVEPAPTSEPARGGGRGTAWLGLVWATVLAAVGVQVYTFVRAAGRLGGIVAAPHLGKLIALFWAAFSLAAAAAFALVRRLGALPIAAVGAVLTAAAITCAEATTGPVVAVAHAFAGAGWGLVFVGGMTAALELAPPERTGLVVGLWFGALALGAFVRIGLVALKLPARVELAPLFAWGPPALVGLGALVLAVLAVARR